MRGSLIAGIAVGAVVATAGGAIAGFRMINRGPQYAEVLAVRPITQRVRTPHEVCKTEEVRHRKPLRDPHDHAGSAIGAVEHRLQANDTYTTIEQHCTKVSETREEPRGYEVRYRLNGIEGTVHMNQAPGARIPVRDGRLVLEDADAAGEGGDGSS